MVTFPFSASTFREMFPAFANSGTFSDSLLQMYYDTAGLYTQNSPDYLVTVGTNQHSLYLMTAHLVQLGQQIGAGQASGITIEATIDKISTSIQQFQYKNQWQMWLASTEYGKQLLALLQLQSVGGFYSQGGFGRQGFKA